MATPLSRTPINNYLGCVHLLVNNTIAELGGDPTVQSPCADVAGVASLDNLGYPDVKADSRSHSKIVKTQGSDRYGH